MGSMSIVHWLIVVGIVVLLFGKHKISDVMGDVAHGIKSFKKGMSDDELTPSKIDVFKPQTGAAPPRTVPVRAAVGGDGNPEARKASHVET